MLDRFTHETEFQAIVVDRSFSWFYAGFPVQIDKYLQHLLTMDKPQKILLIQ